MDRIFEPRGYIRVPDGTDVSAFLNATDASQTDVPWGILGEMSIAAGCIARGVESWIHVHPAVTQVTYLVSGALSIRMKEASVVEPYDLHLRPGQAVVAEPGTLFQLRNTSNGPAEVLYIVSPSYVFELEGAKVVYDDAILVAKSWEALAVADKAATLEISRYEAAASRAEALRRLAVRKGLRPRPLADEVVKSLAEEYDYLAPDGSEIRLLVNGEHGGLAHCVLPAGKVSAPVQHRTVEELWYVLEGQGEIWRERAGEERVDQIRIGDSVRIPVGTSFQFRAAASANLKLLLATMPPWPGPQEAVQVQGNGFGEVSHC